VLQCVAVCCSVLHGASQKTQRNKHTRPPSLSFLTNQNQNKNKHKDKNQNAKTSTSDLRQSIYSQKTSKSNQIRRSSNQKTLIERTPSPRRIFFVGWFPNQELGGGGPPMTNHPQNWSILVVILQKGSSSSGLLIREHSK